jgi:UDP-glucuronate 4-epimerase
MAILITGGAGFIGSRLACRMVQEGQPVIVLDNFNDYYDPAIKRANIASVQALGGQCIVLEGDIRDEAFVENLFRTNKIERVAHLAAMTNVRFSIEQGRQYSDVNVSGTIGLLDIARRYGVETFILGSTSSVYGNTSQIPFREDDAAIAPLAPYPASKRAAELFASTYHHLFGLNVTALRFFNVYGPHGRPDMMPMRVIDAILNEKPVQLFGGGVLKRDWTYIDDIVDGIVIASARPLGFKIINLGYGSPITLLEFIEIYEDLIGKKAIRVDVAAPTSEPFITYCDNTRARELLGFNPKTSIGEGLQHTWSWYRQRNLG